MKILTSKPLRRRTPARPTAAALTTPATEMHINPSTPVFARQPWLQFGKKYILGERVSLELHFDMISEHESLKVQYRTGNGAWRTRKVGSGKKMEIDGIPQTYHYRAHLTKLLVGQPFEYIVLLNKETVFHAVAKAPPGPNKPFSFALTGDIGDGGSGEKQTAAAIHNEDPDVVILVGDIVYEHGRVSELDPHFVNIYNADTCDPSHGAPLLRSRAMAAAVGNHDMGFPSDEKQLDLNRRADLLAYFLFWRHPQNGPQVSHKNLLKFTGKKAKLQRLLGMLGEDFLKKANYSLDFGNVHLTVLDANKYMNWTAPALYDWVKKDLESASNATWKIVVWHQPPFNSDPKYCHDERMSVLSPLLEEHGVVFVFNGHCHFYERSFPISVKLKGEPAQALNLDGTVNGTVYIDKKFDGVNNCEPNGIVYVVTGAGGRPSDDDHKPIDMPFAAKLIHDINTFTMVDVDGETLTMRQMGVDGKELDRIVIRKAGVAK